MVDADAAGDEETKRLVYLEAHWRPATTPAAEAARTTIGSRDLETPADHRVALEDCAAILQSVREAEQGAHTLLTGNELQNTAEASRLTSELGQEGYQALRTEQRAARQRGAGVAPTMKIPVTRSEPKGTR